MSFNILKNYSEDDSDLSNDNTGDLVSRKWGEVVGNILDIFKYEKQATERDKYYKLVGCENDDNRYETWLDYVEEQKVMSGQTFDVTTNIEIDAIELAEKLKEKTKQLKLLIINYLLQINNSLVELNT